MAARRYFIVILLLLVPAQAWAHRHTKALYAAGSDDQNSALYGFQLSGEWMLPKKVEPDPHCDPGCVGKAQKTSRWSLFEDVGVNWGTHEGSDRRQVALMVGGRYTYPLVKSESLESFAHAALAFVHTQDSPTVTDWASGLGFGLGLRYEFIPNWCIRAQFDYVGLWWWARITKDYRRYSAGLEFRFGHFSPGKYSKSPGGGTRRPGAGSN
jgi:hypothetical protein